MYNFPQGNMPLSVGYNVFYGQVLRYSNIISDLENFISATKQLYRILLRRGYDDEQLKRKFRGLIRGRPDVLHKYNVQDINDIQDLVFNIWHIGVAIGIPRSPKDKVHLKWYRAGTIIYSACDPFGVSPRVVVHLGESCRHVVTDGWLQGGLAIIYGPGIQPPKPNCMPSYQLMSLQRLTDIMSYDWQTTELPIILSAS